MTQSCNEADVLSRLRDPTPKGRRKAALFVKLDQMVPSWRVLVQTPEFAQWAAVIDSENGTRMLDRIGSLLDDPTFAAEGLAVILRMFARSNIAESRRTGLRRLFPRGPQRDEPTKRPVLSRKYELIKALGCGGNGEVHLVWSTETEMFYALKTVRSDFLLDSEVRERFRNEASLWISMGEHPNVAKAYFFEEIEPRLFIAMEYVEEEDDGTGPSLEDKLASGNVATGNLCLWVCQVADGLCHAYKNGVGAHRDIKPGNILIDREGVAKISDFGVATALETAFDREARHGYAVGTPLFMSPEQFMGHHECDQRSDIYSLGVMLYQVVSGGTLPFIPENSPTTPAEFARFLIDVRKLHESASPRPLTSFLWPVIAKCLSKRPMDRFSDMKAFRDCLARLAEQHQISIPEPAKETTDFWVHRDQGNTFMRLGRYEDAIKVFDAFLAVLPDDSAAFNRAVCLENLERYEEALQVYKSFAKRDDIKGIVNIGNCFRALGRKEEALEYAKRAVMLEANDVSCWITLGNSHFALESWRDAMNAYANAHRIEPGDPTPAYNFGLAALRAQFVEQAKEAFLAFMDASMPDDKRRPYAEGALRRL